jgi:MarR family 2-MHQ and catechol resistance regulon transcriptional repressor
MKDIDDDRANEPFVEEEVSQSLKLFIVLSRAYKAMNEEVHKTIQKKGLNPTEFAVLELLYHKGEQPMQKIGDKILIASGSITYVVDKLEKKDFIERISCPTDRRITFAKITNKGKMFISSIFPDHAENIHSLLSVLNHEEKRDAISLLKKMGLSIKDLSY